jgi:hypothetical protein
MEIILIWFTSIVVTAILAGRYNRSVGAWFLLSLIFGFLATLVLLALGQAQQPVAMAASAGHAAPENDRRPCPRCGESIARLAQVCRFCGTSELG